MAFISQASIQEVKDRMDAIAAVSDYVQMEQRSGRWWACCPFHQEKTGSFTVNPDLKTYYCFGCHKGGHVINFIMEMDKLSFPETIELLAKRFGVELVYENSGGGSISAEEEAKKKAKDGLFELYHRMSGTFHHFLLKKPESETVKQYIIDRGISEEMIEQFRLGYAPADRYWLHKFLSQKGYSGEFLASSGLFSSRYPLVSLFSGRLMFPIADRQGKTVAFGGRILPGMQAETAAVAEANNSRRASIPAREPPKYINSPELGIYKKGETLFAIDLALPEIKKTKTVYIAEGYMDVIALHQAGVTNALAPLGTAFTDEQAKLLCRWAETAVIFFDSDGAGQAAALKAIYTCRKNGLACALVAPGNTENAEGEPKDPADILRYSGAGALQKRAKSFINDFTFLIDKARLQISLQGKARAVAFLFPYIDLLDSEVAKGSCIESAADALGLLPAVVNDDYRRYALDRKSGAAGTYAHKEEIPRQSGGKTFSPIRLNDELTLLVTVAVDYVSPRMEKLFHKFRTALEINEIEDPNAKELFIALEECIRYGESGMDELLARISSPELREYLVERSVSGEFSANPEKLIADGIKRIRGKRLERLQEEIIIKLRELKNSSREAERMNVSDNSDDSGLEVRELLAEKMRIDKELNLLKQGR